MAYKIKNINYTSISNSDDYVVYTVAFDIEDTKSTEQASFTQDFYFTNETKQDEVTASVISLLSGAVSIMYNKATYYNLSITSDEVADVITTLFPAPEFEEVATATEVPVVEEESATTTPIDSFGEPSTTAEETTVVEGAVTDTTTEPSTDTTTDSTDLGTTDTTSTDTTENNG